MTNAFDPSNSVTTILTQGVSVDGTKVSLSFWADNECKACEHKVSQHRYRSAEVDRAGHSAGRAASRDVCRVIAESVF